MTLRHILESVRESDESVKFRWVVALSAIAMGIVIFVWLAYFNGIIVQSGAPLQEEGAGGFSLGATFRGGGAALFEETRKALRSLRDAFLAPRVYHVSP